MDDFYSFGAISDRRNDDRQLEIHSNSPATLYPKDSSFDADLMSGADNDDASNMNSGFAITITNLDTTDAEGGLVQSSVVRINVKQGEATVVKDVDRNFSGKNFNVPVSVEGLVKIYAEVEIQKQIGAFVPINARIKHYLTSEVDTNGANYRFTREGNQYFMRSLIGTVSVVPRNSGGYFCKVNQIQIGKFSFNPHDGNESDSEGNDTRAGLKEFMVAFNDKLYKCDVDVVSMTLVE